MRIILEKRTCLDPYDMVNSTFIFHYISKQPYGQCTHVNIFFVKDIISNLFAFVVFVAITHINNWSVMDIDIKNNLIIHYMTVNFVNSNYVLQSHNVI